MKHKKNAFGIKKATIYFLAIMLSVVFYNQLFVMKTGDTIGDEPQLGNSNNPVNKTQEGIEKQKEQETESNLQTLSDKKITWGVGKNKNELNQPSDVLPLQEKYEKLGAYFLEPTEQKRIYLTFDAGYENGNVKKIVDVLKEKEVKATFFLVSDVFTKCPDLVREIINDGHVVGNHTWKHLSAPEASLNDAREDIEKLHQYVKETWNYEMNLFRFPKGEFSEQTLAQAQELGYRSLFWSFAYADWDESKQVEPKKALETLKEGLHPGAIYLLHPTSSTNAAVLGDFIDYCKEQGYEFYCF